MAEGRTYRIMISGGGTGGHIYPAISVAQALNSTLSEVKILFVGAQGKMEMRKVPDAGFEIVGLWISGIQRKLSLKNLLFPFKLVSSIFRSYQLIREFRPDVVVGFGGFASGPLLYAAARRKIPTVIQEQNYYAGLTNKWLADKVDRICVAYEGLEKYFPKEKLVVTGNPVRLDIKKELLNREKAMDYFNLDPSKKTLLVLGGSLGAKTINECVFAGLASLKEAGIQLLWQTGSFYYDELTALVNSKEHPNVQLRDFIREMKHAYAVADIVISRAGALSIAELMLTGKATILVPSPNVAEDHQTLNANALLAHEAALMVKDAEAAEKLIPTAIETLQDAEKCDQLASRIYELAKPRAVHDIANEIIKLTA
ncbi:MAG: undecaprenyldiphospho-muramoylpentapeptide beta-N-acetylglucosaminyltransferase [Bacteroidota bacterium]